MKMKNGYYCLICSCTWVDQVTSYMFDAASVGAGKSGKMQDLNAAMYATFP